MCGNTTPSDADNICYDCIGWFSARDRRDMEEKWPAWLRNLEIDRSLDIINRCLDPRV